MGRRRLLVIANPRAGSGAAESIAESVRMDLVERGLAPELRLTEGPGHARELARAGHDLVINGQRGARGGAPPPGRGGPAGPGSASPAATGPCTRS